MATISDISSALIFLEENAATLSREELSRLFAAIEKAIVNTLSKEGAEAALRSLSTIKERLVPQEKPKENTLGAILRKARDLLPTFSPEGKRRLGTAIERLSGLLGGVTAPPLTPTGLPEALQGIPPEPPAPPAPPPSGPELPTGAAPVIDPVILELWYASGGDDRVFTSYLTQYPDPTLNAIARDSGRLNALLTSLEAIPAQAPPANVDGIQSSAIPSSNVWGFAYDKSSKTMYVKFNGKDERDDGPVYAYGGVPGNIARVVMAGAIPARTRGQNRWGRWWVNKNPSMGASVSALLVKGAYPYQRIS